jgi:type II secretory pathway pseudopilin PulG
VVVVILGILAGIANNMLNARKFAVLAALKADMRTLAGAQEEYYMENYSYANSLSHLDINIRSEVLVTMVATGDGWSMRVRHRSLLDYWCSMFHGEPNHSFPPATEAGVMECVPKVRGMGGGGGGGGGGSGGGGGPGGGGGKGGGPGGP